MTPDTLIEKASALDPQMTKAVLLLLLERLSNALHTDERGGSDFYLVDSDDLQQVLVQARAVAAKLGRFDGPASKLSEASAQEADPIAEMFRLIGA